MVKTKKTPAKKEVKPSDKKKAVVKVKEKVKIKVEAEKKTEKKEAQKDSEKYYEAIGRRKEATARVRLYTKKSTDKQDSENVALIIVNKKPYPEYFRQSYLQDIVEAPLKKLKSANRFKASVFVVGGGVKGQAEASRLGLARALTLFDKNFSKKLKRAGYLTVDSRVKERRKYGLKKARKAPQWRKR